MGKIVYLCGKSSTGKDTVYRRLLEDKELNLKTIVPYTTRPIREGEVEGREYHFIDEAQVAEFERLGRIIELRAYNTVHGIWKYMTVDDGSFDLTKESYIYIGTLESYINSVKYFSPGAILPILIEVDDGVRLTRALEREKRQDNPKYEELCRRFLADAADFSKEKIAEAGITRRFINEDLDRCVEEVKKYISENV